MAPSSGWVYVIEAKGQSLFKVGLTTREPSQRLAELQTSCPHELDLITAFRSNKNTRALEKMFHRMLEGHASRAQGEWFAVTRETILDMMMHFYAGIAQSAGLIEHRSHPQR